MEPEIHVTGIGAIVFLIGLLLGAVNGLVFIIGTVFPFLLKMLENFWHNFGLEYWLWLKWTKHEHFKSHTKDFWDLKFRVLNNLKNQGTIYFTIRYYIFRSILRDLKKYHGREI